MDIQQLRYFIVVAQYLSFSKASRHLYIAQPGLSQSIARLEKELGLKLLKRDNRSVKLTAAGKVFLNEAIEIINKLDDAIIKTHKARNEFSGALSIGFLPSLGDKNLPYWIATFREKFPDINIKLRLFTESALHLALAAGEIDMGYARCLLSKNDPDLQWENICTGTISFIVPRGHPLADRKKVKFTELCREPLILLEKQECPRFYQFLMQYYKSRNINPYIVDHARRLDGLLPLIASGAGVGIMASCNSTMENPDVRFIQVEDAGSFFSVGFCWNQSSANDNIPLFISHIIEKANNADTEYRCTHCRFITESLPMS